VLFLQEFLNKVVVTGDSLKKGIGGDNLLKILDECRDESVNYILYVWDVEDYGISWNLSLN